MSEEFYLVTVEVNRVPRPFEGTVMLENNNTQNLYYQIMHEVYLEIASENNWGTHGDVISRIAHEIVGATLFYWHEPLELRRA